MSELTENIKVFVRVRPPTGFDLRSGVHIQSDHEILVRCNATGELKYKFNGIFSEHIHQDEAYNVILVPIVRDFIQGYNCTLFSYGATRNDGTNTNASNFSLVSSTPIAPPPPPSTNSKCPQATDDAMTALHSCTMYRLFEHLTQLELSSSVRISYLEIHNEELYDLLQPNQAAATQLKIFETDKNQVYISGLSETMVHSAAEALMVYRMAQKNVHSVKSHTIFTIAVQTKETPKFQMQENEGLFKFRKLCLVQLGSQESQKKQARAKTVQSLTSLSRVVQALTNKQSHIPYRDSKLTRIMQESLGGNAKTSIVASIGSGNNCIEETVQALEFLNRMKNICNHPKVNERLDDSRTLNEMALEIRKLIMDIEANRNKTGHFLTDEMYVNYQNEMQTTRVDARRHKHELMLVNEERVDLDCTFSNVNSSLCVKNMELAQLQSETKTKQKQLKVISNVTQHRDVLIGRYAMTEQQITKQAIDITNTVQNVLDDKTQLDDCVSRYKSTDDRLLQTVQRFQTDMQQKLGNLKENSTMVLAIIDVKLQKAGDLEKHFLRSASSLTEIIKMKSFLLLGQLDEHRTKESNEWNDIRNDFDDALQARLKSIDSNITLYKEYARKFEEQSNTIEASYREVRELYQNHFVTEDQMIGDIKQRMKTHSEDVSGQIKALRLTVDECAEIGKNIDEKMNLVYQEMCEIVSQIQKNTAEIKNTIEPALETSEMNIQQTRKAIIESLNAHEIAVKEQKLLFVQSKLPDDFKTKQSMLKNLAQQKTMLMNDTLDRVAMNNITSMECGRKHAEAISVDVPSKCAILDSGGRIQTLKHQLNTNQERLRKQNKENIAAVNDIIRKSEEMCKKNAYDISSCVEEMNNFRDKDYCEYQSSGETPTKREYTTDVPLAATTPLDKIKQRFRERMSQINTASPNADYSFLND